MRSPARISGLSPTPPAAGKAGRAAQRPWARPKPALAYPGRQPAAAPPPRGTRPRPCATQGCRAAAARGGEEVGQSPWQLPRTSAPRQNMTPPLSAGATGRRSQAGPEAPSHQGVGFVPLHRTFCFTATRVPSSSSTVISSAECMAPAGRAIRYRVGTRADGGGGTPRRTRGRSAEVLPPLTSIGRVQRPLDGLPVLPAAGAARGAGCVTAAGGGGGSGQRSALSSRAHPFTWISMNTAGRVTPAPAGSTRCGAIAGCPLRVRVQTQRVDAKMRFRGS
jgi:hypothetical protein